MRLRIDLVDLMRWRVACPWHKLLAHVIVATALSLLSLPFMWLGMIGVWIQRWLLGQAVDIFRWSGYIPEVLDETDAPGLPRITYETIRTLDHVVGGGDFGCQVPGCAFCETPTENADKVTPPMDSDTLE